MNATYRLLVAGFIAVTVLCSCSTFENLPTISTSCSSIIEDCTKLRAVSADTLFTKDQLLDLKNNLFIISQNLNWWKSQIPER
jgi:hypothetical protein